MKMKLFLFHLILKTLTINLTGLILLFIRYMIASLVYLVQVKTLCTNGYQNIVLSNTSHVFLFADQVSKLLCLRVK